jgi:hypothetical protein
MAERPPPRELQKKLCGLAEKIAGGFDAHLDYSVESIREVERILGRLHEDYKRTHSEDGVRGIALEFAAYIITVIERHFEAGDWQRDDPSFGPDSFPFHWRGSTIYPYGWCMKRILDGPGDDVWFKFRAIVLGESQPQPPRRPWWRFW